MGRQDGFYWVHLHMEWGVAEWVDGDWWVAGADVQYADSDFSEIDERRIERLPWQPIESAPKDGSTIDLWTQFGRVTDCAWKHHNWLNGKPVGEETWFTPQQDPERRLEPTHWMLAPPTPASP